MFQRVSVTYTGQDNRFFKFTNTTTTIIYIKHAKVRSRVLIVARTHPPLTFDNFLQFTVILTLILNVIGGDTEKMIDKMLMFLVFLSSINLSRTEYEGKSFLNYIYFIEHNLILGEFGFWAC